MGNVRDKPFIVKSEKAFGALPHWLKERGCNTYSWSGRGAINVGHDTKPDSDWGGRYEWRGRIVVCDESLFEKTCAAIEKAYGWAPRAAAEPAVAQ